MPTPCGPNYHANNTLRVKFPFTGLCSYNTELIDIYRYIYIYVAGCECD